jgi:hypothetical protein
LPFAPRKFLQPITERSIPFSTLEDASQMAALCCPEAGLQLGATHDERISSLIPTAVGNLQAACAVVPRKTGVPEDVRRLCMSRIKLFAAPAAVLSLVALAGFTVAGGGGQPPGGQIPGNPVPSGQQPGQVPQGFVPGQPPQGVTIPGQSPQGVQSAQSAMHGQGMHMHYMECARVCDDCARICNLCSTHCARLTATGQQQHLQTLATCQDCATVCKAASECSARMGPFASQICMACADICRRCAEACDRSGDDQMMRQCAQECRRCEQACRIMVSRTGGPHAQ